MINPFRDDLRSRQVISPRDKYRMYMMGALFVFALVSFFGFRTCGQAARDADLKARERPIGAIGNVDPAPQVDENGNPVFAYSPETPQERRDLVQDALLQGLTKLVSEGKLVDSVPADDPAVFRYLYREAFRDYRVFGVPPAFHEKLDVAKVTFEPGPYRGRFVSAFGRVIRIEPDRTIPAEADAPAETLHGVLFEDDDGALVEAWGTHPITRAPGEWIQVYGIFYRLRPVEREGVKQDALCLVLLKPTEEAFEPLVVEKVDPAWAKEVKERTFDEANNIDERPFWLLLNYAKHLGLEGYEKLKTEPGFSIRDFGRLARDLARMPEEFRFRFVAAEGRITDVIPDFPQSDNVGKIDRVYFGVLVQPEQYLVRVISPRPFAEWGLVDETPYVRVEGLFYKAWQYVPRGGGDAFMIPIMIVTGVYSDSPGKSEGLATISFVIAILGLAVIGLFVFLGLRNPQGLNEFRARYRERKEARRLKAAGSPPTEVGPPAAEEPGESSEPSAAPEPPAPSPDTPPAPK